ncbi:MAG: diguanylate cyclase [Thermaerobacterales bacterium]
MTEFQHRLLDDFESQFRHQETLCQLAHYALAGSDLRFLFQEVLIRITSTIGAPYGIVLQNLPAEQPRNEFNLSDREPEGGTAGVSLLRGAVGWLDNAVGRLRISLASDRRNGVDLPSILRDHGVVNGISVNIAPAGPMAGADTDLDPETADRDAWGTLSIYTDEDRNFSPLDMAFVQSAAHLLGMAIARREREKALQDGENRYRLLLESVADLVFTLDRQQRHTGIFGRVLEKFKLDPDFFLGRSAGEIMPGEAAAPHQEACRLALSGQTTVYEWSLDINGKTHYFQTSLAPLKNAQGVIEGAVGVGRDITDLKQTAEALSESEERFRLLVELSPEAIFVQSSGEIVFANSAAAALLGVSEPGDIYGSSIIEFLHPDTLEAVRDGQLRKALERGEQTPMLRQKIRRADNRTVEVEFVAVRVPFQGKNGVQIIARDITERLQTQKQMEHMAYHDALTGLPNRRRLQENLKTALEQAMRRGQILAIMFIDLDGFKTVNTTQGHQAGDLLLKKVAKRLQSHTTAERTIARIGGDEFVFVLSDFETKEDIARIAAQCLQSLEEPFTLAGRAVRIAGSVGIAVYPQDGDDTETLIRKANLAMNFGVKENGGNDYQFFDTGMQSDTLPP